MLLNFIHFFGDQFWFIIIMKCNDDEDLYDEWTNRNFVVTPNILNALIDIWQL